MHINETIMCLKVIETKNRINNVQKVETSISNIMRQRAIWNAVTTDRIISHAEEDEEAETTLENYNEQLFNGDSSVYIQKTGLKEICDCRNGSEYVVYYPYDTGNAQFMDEIANSGSWVKMEPGELKDKLLEAAGITD